MAVNYPCRVCDKNTRLNSIQCNVCNYWIHNKCANLTLKELELLGNSDEDWYCPRCIEDIFPFTQCDCEEFFMCINDMNLDILETYIKCKDINVLTESYDTNRYIDGVDIIQHVPSCKYQMIDQLSINKCKGLTILQVNCRGFSTNFYKLENLIQEIGTNIDIIACSETWTSDDRHDMNVFNLDNYSMTYCNRKDRRGGGVAIYVANKYKVNCCNDLTFAIENCMEVVTIDVKIGKKHVYISSIYRAPNTDLDSFINDHYVKLLNGLRYKNMYICGDFNVNLLNYDKHSDTKIFVDLNYSYGLFPLINKPTRICKDSMTIIDNIFTNDTDNLHKMNCGILIYDISDHLPTIVTIEGLHGNSDKIKHNKSIWKRTIKESNIQKMKNLLNECHWDHELDGNDVNVSYNRFVKTFLDCYNNACPKKRVEIKNDKKSDKPWFTKGLRNACKKKQHLYKAYLCKRTEMSEKRYKIYKNKLTKVLRCEEKRYYDRLLMANKGDMQKTWNVLKKIIGKKSKLHTCNEFVEKGLKITNPNDIAKGFNEFFVNVGPNLASKIKNKGNTTNKAVDYLKDINFNESLFLKPVTEFELLSIVNKFKSKASCGYDEINMSIVRKVIHPILIPLLHICNLSLNSGVFPDAMKIAKVLPFFKSGEDNIFSNYRPVSLLPQFSKILEKLFNNRLVEFIEKFQLLCESQYGFRYQHSTSHALCELYEKITLAIDNNEIPIGVFIDLRKAFDTIDHTILLNKLERYGIRGVANSWLTSYLSNRYQFVEHNQISSQRLKIRCGVPQGSILGPTLFILYINDMYKVSNKLKFILFADDTNILISGKDINQVCNTLNTELAKLCNWFSVNKLSLNIGKTNYMIFGNRHVTSSVDICMDRVKVNQINVTKFLGVYIDSKLTWNNHVDYIHNKISRNLGILYKVSKVLNEESLHTLYSSLVLPYLQYCCEIWGNGSAMNCDKLFRLQKKAMRIISHSTYREHTSPIFYATRCLKLKDLIHLKTAVFMYNVTHMRAPSVIENMFKQNIDVHSHNTRIKESLHKPECHCKLRSKAMPLNGVAIWNRLEVGLKSVTTSIHFKKVFKDMVFHGY